MSLRLISHPCTSSFTPAPHLSPLPLTSHPCPSPLLQYPQHGMARPGPPLTTCLPPLLPAWLIGHLCHTLGRSHHHMHPLQVAA